MAFAISNQEHQHNLLLEHNRDHCAEVHFDLSDILQYLTSAKLCCANLT